jgi:hypothetical protein
MPKIEKILLLDREFVKLSEDEFDELRNEYAEYCADTFKFVTNIKGIPNKEAKSVVFGHLLSPFQYFLEDKVRLKKLDRGELKNPFDYMFKKK